MVYVGLDDRGVEREVVAVPDDKHDGASPHPRDADRAEEETMKTNKYRVGPEATISDDDVDLDLNPIVLPSGKVLDNEAAAVLGELVVARVARNRGRPSLTHPGVHSPQVSSRVNPELKTAIEDIASRDGIRPADVVRQALQEYVATHSD